MVDNSGSSRAQMTSLSQEGSLAGGYPQGGVAGVKLEAVMEQLQRQQQARLEMERKERHMRESHIKYAQQVAAQQAILAATRVSGSPLGGAAFLGKPLGEPVSVTGQQAQVSNRSSVDSELEDKEGRGRDSDDEEDEEEEMEGVEGSEEDGEGSSALDYLRKQTLALQQGSSGLPGRPFPLYSTSPSTPGAQSGPSPLIRVKQEPEGESPLPAGPQSSTSPDRQADWGYGESFRQPKWHWQAAS